MRSRWGCFVSGLSPRAQFRLKKVRLRIRPRPMMARREIDMIRSILSTGFFAQIVEFGAGGSTLYFPRFLPADGRWISFESDEGWYGFLERRVPASVSLRYYRSLQQVFSSFARDLRQADLVPIDGGAERARCIELVAEHCPASIVLLHDSQRNGYRLAKERYVCEIPLSKGYAYEENGACLAGGLSILLPSRYASRSRLSSEHGTPV